jgi:PKD repeat protein
VATGDTVIFDASGTYDPNGTIESYNWDFGNGGTSSVSSPVHTYDAPDSYQVSLTVTNNRGKTDTKSMFVFVYAGTVVLCGPALITAEPATYRKTELAFQVKADYANPYNPEQVRVDAVITSPGGVDSIVMPCFYYVGPYFQQGNWYTDTTLKEWRLRFLSGKPGDYAVKLKYYGAKTEVSPELIVSVVTDSLKGIVREDGQNNQYYRHETGEPYYPLGINIGWNDIETYSAILHNIANYHGNFFRYWHTPFAQQALR